MSTDSSEFIIPGGVAVHVLRLGNPWENWRRHRTRRMLHYGVVHEAHRQHDVFLDRDWKLLVHRKYVLIASGRLYYGRSGEWLLRLPGGEQAEFVQLDARGQPIRRIAPGHPDYRKYVKIWRSGGGKDPRDYRT